MKKVRKQDKTIRRDLRIIGHRIREARVDRGLSVIELAECAGVTRQALYKVEDHTHIPSVVVLCRIAGALEWPVARLLVSDKF